ncbi:chromosome segregation protein SMC [Myxococcaceae bacterium GXIMD 01537]
MHFLEVAVQQVRGFSATGRFAFKPAYLVLKPPTAEASPLAGLALALLYPDGRGGDAGFIAPGQQKGKAAFTMQGQDGVTYRLLRELGGSGSLHRLNPSSQQPELVSQDAAEMGQYLRSQVGLPPRTTFEQVCCLLPAQMPSRRPKPKPAAPKPDPKAAGHGGHGGSKLTLATAITVLPAEDIPAAEAKVRALEQELAQARAVDEVQFQADGVSSQLFDIESKLKGTEGLQVAIREAEAAWKAEPSPTQLGLPQDILQRIQRYPKVVARRDEQLTRLNADREADAQVEDVYVEPLTKNRIFWAGVGAGVLCLLLGVVLNGLGKYVALLDIPAFGVAAVVALRYVDELQQGDRKGRKGDRFASREKKILEEFEAEDSILRLAASSMKVDNYADIPVALERKELLRQRMEELREQLAQYEAAPEFQSAAAQRDELRQQAEAFNAKLAQMGSYSRDSREVERELSRVKESIALARAPAAPAAPGAAAEPSAEPLEDPSPVLLNQASDLLTLDILATGAALRERCTQYLTALTDRRYQGVEWDKEGKGYVLTQGKRQPVGEMPPKDLDLYYLSLRMTVVEKVSAKVKLPLLIDNALTGVDEAKLPLVGRMLKHLGTLTQVLHVTPHPGFPQVSDGTVNV